MLIVGHRGARGLASENTLEAFKKALSCGTDQLELDLRVSLDGRVVITHNPELSDVSGHKLEVKASSFEDLKAACPDLLSFDELLDFINAKATLYIEIKPGVDCGPIVDIIKSRLSSGWPADKLLIASFDFAELRQVQSGLPELELVVNESWSSIRACYRARRLNTQYIALNQTWLWWGLIASLARRGYKLYCYTLNDVSRARAWQKHGLYGVITDYPDRFQD